MRVRKLFFGFIAALFFSCGIAHVAYAGRPLSTDDAGTVSPGHLDVELAGEYLEESNRDKEASFSVNFTTGVIWDRLDFAISVPYLCLNPGGSEDCNGFGDLQTNFKLRYVDESDYLPALAVTTGVKTETGDCEKGLGTGGTNVIANLIATKSFKKITLHGNLGYNATEDLQEEESFDFISLGLAGEYVLTEKLTLVSEIFSEFATKSIGEDDPVEILLGATYAFPTETVLDCAMAFGLTDGAPDYRITVGLTHEF